MMPRTHRPEQFRFPPANSVPEWARKFFALNELRAFYRAVEDALMRRASWFEVRDGFLVVHPPTGGLAQCGLYNVALRCSSAGVAEYPALVEEHFKRVFAQISEELEDPEQREGTVHFADVRAGLRIRIYNDAFLRRPGEPPLQRKLAADLNAVVVLDYPNLAASLQPSMLQELGGTEEEAFACAIANCRDLPCTREPMPVDGFDGFALMDDGYYVTSQVLHLERHLPAGHLSGALVALPTRHMIMVWPVVPEQLQTAVSAMSFVGRNIYRERAADGESTELSESLYWWLDGELVYVPVLGEDGGQQAMVVPPEFLERMMMARLPRGARA